MRKIKAQIMGWGVAYNSNSFARGLLAAIGKDITPKELWSNHHKYLVPGWNDPLDLSYFEGENN